MKITKKNLQDLIKEETNKILSEKPATATQGATSPAAEEKAERKRLLAIIKDPNASKEAIKKAKEELAAMGPPGYDPDQESLPESLTAKKFKSLIKEELTNLLQERSWTRDEQIDNKLESASQLLARAKQNSSMYHLQEAVDDLRAVITSLQGKVANPAELAKLVQTFAQIGQPKSTNPPA